MKTEKFRRSDNVEDYRDPNKPLDKNDPAFAQSINEMMALHASQLAKDIGTADVKEVVGESKAKSPVLKEP